ncbi:MAG TPA: type 1 glutamine amidotransferase [Kiritimatiellia bacterium]|nr:type 1 glutamine amidotransferase [Kiritimatiellia bacterium]HMP00623.1 type 1 glutamine amidotransferase [Kiritimatiellia bacterium]
MNTCILQHVSFEGPALIADLLAARGWGKRVVPLYKGAPLPGVSDFDLLVVMGGPMSVNDEAEFPWLVAEKSLIREAIAADKAILGVCLGAQLIASALGARVYANAQKEIGWWPIEPVAPNVAGVFAFPPNLTVFHWHGETFDLPEGAVHLARSVACEHQAFQIGHRIIGLQFHLETTPESARLLIDNARHELAPAPFVQTESELLSPSAGVYDRCREALERVMEAITPTAG